MTALTRQTSRRALTHQLWVHDTNSSQDDLILNPELFPNVKVGDLIEICSAEKEAAGEKSMIFRVQNLAQQKGNLQVSVRRDIAELFQFPVRKEISVKVVLPAAVSVDFIELSVKDQFVTGGEMWSFRCAILNECVYTQKKITIGTLRAQVKELMNGTTPVQFGLITEHTKFAFRSRSARYFFLFQMSREMWEFAHDGHLYFEKAVNGFMRVLLDRWKALSVEHSVSIIFFSRTYFTGGSGPTPLKVDYQGRPYEDFYKVIMLDDCRQDLDAIPLLLKREFCAYRALVDAYLAGIEWPVSSLNSRYTPENSSAASGNLLEAISLILTSLEASHIDPDLGRTNHNVIVLSAGNGLFQVDHDLAIVTKHRMIDLGLGCDLVCLAPPPLHVVPLFSTSHDAYAVPHWITISYFNTLDEEAKDAKNDWVPTNTIKAEPPLRTAAPKFYVPHLKGKLATNPYFSSHFSAYDDAVWTKTVAPTPAPSASSLPASASSMNVSTLPTTPNRSTNNPPSLLVSSSNEKDEKGEKRDSGNTSSKDVHLKAPPLASPTGTSPHLPPKLSNSGSGHNISIAFNVPNPSPSATAGDAHPKRGLKSSGTVLFALPAKTSTRARVSPFLQEVAPPGPSSIRRRWAHLVPVNLRKHEPNWKSLTEPACLPCTTDYFPPTTELNAFFKQSVFQLSLIPDENVGNQKTEDLLRELINQRLDRGYQLILLAAGDKEFYLQHGSLLNTRTRQIRLGLGRTYQLITYDPEAQNIEVKRYYRDFTLPSKRKSSQMLNRADGSSGSQESGGSAGMSANSGQTPMNDWARINTLAERDYTYALSCLPCNQRGVRFEAACATSALQYSNAALYNWNYLDELVCGYNSTFSPGVRYNRVRMLLLPLPSNLTARREGGSKEALVQSNGSNDGNNEDDSRGALREARIANFEKLKELLRDRSVTIGGFSKIDVQVAPARRRTSVVSWSDLIAAATHPRNGLTQRSGPFAGSDLVDWILKSIDSVKNMREEAVRLCQHMVEAKIIRNQADKNAAFQDSKSVLYRWKKSTEGTGPKQEKLKKSWFSFFTSNAASDKQLPKPAPHVASDAHLPPSRYTHKLARLDMNEDKKQVRYQWLLLQYDSFFDPDWAFALEFQWISCSSSVMEEFLVRCQRKAKSLQLSLVQVPSDFFGSTIASPFRRSQVIPLASLPDLSLQESTLLPLLVLQRFEFNYLIRPPPSQHAVGGKEDPLLLGQVYIHKSGVALVRYGREGFIWDTNDLLAPGRQIGPEKCPVSASALYSELVEFAASAEKLQELLAAALAKQSAEESNPPAQTSPQPSLTASQSNAVIALQATTPSTPRHAVFTSALSLVTPQTPPPALVPQSPVGGPPSPEGGAH